MATNIVGATGIDKVQDGIIVNADIDTVDAGKLTGALPAISGASLTAIPAGNLTGTVADARISALTSSKLTGALPAISAANLTAIPAANITGALPAISGASLTGLTSSQMPAGSVLQVVHGAYSTQMSTTSGSTWVATGAEITITPTSSSSKILVMFNQHIRVDKANNDIGIGFSIRRGTTTVWSTPSAIAFYSYNGTDSVQNDKRLYQPLTYLDSPNTTSATTYSTRLIEYGSGTAYAQTDSSPTMMTLMEIAG